MKGTFSTRLHFLLSVIMLIAILGTSIGCASRAASAKKLETVKMAVSTPVLPFVTYYIAVQQGYFTDEGYQTELVITGGSGPDVEALIAGNVDFALTGMGNVLPAYDQGQRVIAIQNMYDLMTFDLVLRKTVADQLGIREDMPLDAKLQALRGRTIAATKVGSLSHMLARMYAQRAGLAEGKDVSIIAAGSYPAAVAALEKGEVDAILDIPPTEQKNLRSGLTIRLVNNSGGEDPELAGATFEVVAIRSDYANQQPNRVRKITRAFTRANRWVTTASLEQIADVLATFLKGFERADLIEAAKLVKLGVRPDGQLTEQGVKVNQQMLLNAGIIKRAVEWAQVATNAYLPTNLKP